MRESGVELSAAFSDGVRAEGVDIVDLGMASTDFLYFASGHLDSPGAMFTASHNPATTTASSCACPGPGRSGATPAWPT